MSTQLTPEAETQLRALARKISLSNELAPDLQEELYGHLEDKTLGYLSGDEAVSEEDAVLLTLEHFGDPRRVKSLLASVHHVPALIGVMRALAAMAILTICARCLIPLALSLLYACILLAGGKYAYLVQEGFGKVIQPAILPVCLIVIASRWRQRENSGEALWYARWPGYRLGIALALLLLAEPALPRIEIWILRSDALAENTYAWFSGVVQICSRDISEVVNIVFPLLWIWWADRPPRRWAACGWGFAGYLLFTIVLMQFPSLIGTPIISTSNLLNWHFEMLPGSFLDVSLDRSLIQRLGLPTTRLLLHSMLALAFYLAARKLLVHRSQSPA